jgi:hypothetical protein
LHSDDLPAPFALLGGALATRFTQREQHVPPSSEVDDGGAAYRCLRDTAISEGLEPISPAGSRSR